MKLIYWSKLMTEAAIINFPETGQTCVFGGVGGAPPSAVHHSDSRFGNLGERCPRGYLG